MSHFTVLVLGGNINEQLAKFDEQLECEAVNEGPVSDDDTQRFIKRYQEVGGTKTFDELYDENGEDWNYNSWRKNAEGVWEEWSSYNPDSKWDWYQVGGRWGGFFTTKNGVAVDTAKKSEIDFDGMRNDKRNKAIHYYGQLQEAFGGSIPKLSITWEEAMAIPDKSRDEQREIFHSQDAMELVKIAKENNKELFGWSFDLEEFDCTEDEYGQRAYNSAVSTYAVVKDGVWYQKGEMGWWGMSTDEVTQDEWDIQLTKMINECSNNTEFALVDCHI